MDFARRLVPAAIRRRYAVKFGIALLILILSVGLVGYAATAEITNQMEDQVETDHSSATEQEAQSLQMWNSQNEHTVEMIARSNVVASDDPAAIEQQFLDWEEHLDNDAFDISYVDLNDGTVTASTTDAFRGASTADLENVPESAYANATQTVPWVSDASLAESEAGQNRTVITYVQRSAANEDRAIIYTADLEAYANDLESDDGTTTMVLNGDNEVMLDDKGYGENHETLGQAYGGDTSLLTAARTEGATTQRVDSSSLTFETDAYDFTDDEYVTSSAPVVGTDWVVVTHEPASQAFGFVTTINEYGIYATILAVLLIGMVGAVLGRNTAVSIGRLADKASQMEEGNLDVDLETNRIDNIGRLYDGFDSMRDALREQTEEAEAAREEAERERKRAEEINSHLEDKATEYSTVMGKAADGDLTARATVESDSEQMQQIGEDINEMLDEIELTIAELSRFATDVATASEQVTASSEEVRSASQQVTGSVQEISDGADRQNESLQSVNQEMSGLSTTTEEIAASSNEVADIAERTVNTGQEGKEAAQTAITAMDEIETEAGDAVAEMRRLEEEVQQIDELINTISEIARQTNMLALNANIEASRSASGSDDEGFSVVAKEVKALSEDVAQAADEAEDRLEAIRERTEQSAAEVEGTSADIEDATEQVQDAVEALEEIADLAQETNIGVQEISAATEEQAASTQEVVAMVDNAATISEETTAEAENVAAAAEQQTTALTEVTESASSLSEQAAQLSEALDKFDTDIDTDEVDFESTFDVDAELSVSDASFDADEMGLDDQTGGITLEATDASATDALENMPAADTTDEASSEDALEMGPADDADELDADEILGIESDESYDTDDGALESVGDADTAGDDAADPLADDADPLAELDADSDDTDDAFESTAEDGTDDATAQPLGPADDEFDESDTDDATAQPLGPVDDESGGGDDGTAQPLEPIGEETDDEDGEDHDDDVLDNDDASDDDADDTTESDDVFTFGTTDDE
ncbi:methyl-accepting chemotaxis protein [Natrinema limicola]|uniref:Chemotaxis sensory transducer n=1 Tax=Natrinema limicola JCM 13563 TaxID=1230457 RepID=M0CJK8_9EURY|nr:methyl-accepting chemotaxis protein [Natrinema limicola]ELZ22054.1 chemotaxis sensory transducer [Natrinema limicola JCM 13563]